MYQHVPSRGGSIILGIGGKPSPLLSHPSPAALHSSLTVASDKVQGHPPLQLYHIILPLAPAAWR